MKKPALQILRACSLTIALLGSVAIVAAVSVPDTAFAKGGNEGGNGNGGGNGKGNGNGGGADKAKGKANGADAPNKTKAKTKTKTKTKTKAKTNWLIDELGVHPSDLGALNAAHANPNALKNASPNSRVGRIAAFRDAVLAGRELEAEIDEKAALLESLEPPARPIEDIETALDDATDDVATKAGAVADLEAALDAAGGTDVAIQEQLDLARDALALAEETEAALQDELADAQAYADLDAEIAELEARLADQPELERSLLEAAANKPVTDAVEEAVKKLLGL